MFICKIQKSVKKNVNLTVQFDLCQFEQFQDCPQQCKCVFLVFQRGLASKLELSWDRLKLKTKLKKSLFRLFSNFLINGNS